MLNLMEIRNKLNDVYDVVVIEWKCGKKEGPGKIYVDCDYAFGYYVTDEDDRDRYFYFSRKKENCTSYILDYLVRHQKFIKSVDVKL